MLPGFIPVIGQFPAATVTFISSNSGNSSGSSQTVTGSVTNQRVVVAFWSRTGGTATSVTAATLNSVNCSQVVAAVGGIGAGGSTRQVWMAITDSATTFSGSCTFTVTLTNGGSNFVSGFWAITASSYTALTTSTDTTNQTVDLDLNIPSGSIIIATVGNNSGGTYTWTASPLAEDYDLSPGSRTGSGASGAYNVGGSPVTVRGAGTVALAGGGCAAAWR